MSDTGLLPKIMKRLKNPRRVVSDCRKIVNRIRKPGVVRIRGVKIPLGDHITAVIRGYMYDGTYESEEAQVLARHLRSGDVTVELGGGLGFLSAYCSRRLGPGNVHVYEANARLEPLIRKLYALNGVAPDLRMYALGAKTGTLEFHVGEDFWDSSAVASAPKTRVAKVSVPVKAFGEEISTFSPRPNFLICDIEGGEYELFMGIELTGIKKILCEVHESVLGKVKIAATLAAIERQGFVLNRRETTEHVWFLERP